ncbi:DNA primase [Agrobacterium vitis]|uniref:DNA primase n=1 Tax=Agrobacterium vitis TaxID=373 RepID=A0A368NVL2_AGRVI|nr:toprim domain-containing protein [Agrobacterium vitis]KAA3513740.1 DNA primase [Agrobacterium vitis]KAA3528321.1 DNA primase [Agrobacterium vitis]MUZ97835.1 DNA primase [Agrobacterium vitis]MVA32559.1 DNA primase [Agrobacterium vitis]NOJ35619.1 DNA primase [Agrobacterium vitis]
MSRHDASDLAIRLGRNAEAVCRHYLSSGHRAGRYWLVGDPQNNPGRSMFVRLTGPETGKGAAGKWTDGATREHGDLLDVIREALGLVDFRDVAEEARRFLSLPHPEPERTRTPTGRTSSVAVGSPEASRRLFAMSQPIGGTLAEIYLDGRAIRSLEGTTALRYHPRCYYRPDEHSPTEIWPAIIASVTDLAGRQTGAHRTWLAPDGSGKALVETPRRAMGDLLGYGVRFGIAGEVLAAGEGIETVLSPRQVLPHMPMLAALSAAHLAAILFPATLRRLYVLRDRDPAGDGARDSLIARAESVGIEAIALSPVGEDFNDDLRWRGVYALRATLMDQLRPEDVSRFMEG